MAVLAIKNVKCITTQFKATTPSNKKGAMNKFLLPNPTRGVINIQSKSVEKLDFQYLNIINKLGQTVK